MLWEVPLTVALHFLGVPEEDMEELRSYSIAHTVNTWGRPAFEEQVAVAEAVGKFWQYAGTVLEKMRKDPSAHGWMPFGIRVQQEQPDVVTDSYLHSMMMAGSLRRTRPRPTPRPTPSVCCSRTAACGRRSAPTRA